MPMLAPSVLEVCDLWFYRGSQVCLALQKRLWTRVFKKHWNCRWELLDHMQTSVLGGPESVHRGLEDATWVRNVLHRSVYVYAVFAPLLRALLSKALGASGSGATVLKVKHGSWSYLDVSSFSSTSMSFLFPVCHDVKTLTMYSQSIIFYPSA